MIRSSRRLLATVAAAGLLTVTACGADSPSTDATGAAAAGASGEALVLYSGRNENLVQPLLDQFSAQTGIDVTPRYGGTAELAAQLLEEGDRTPASVFLAQDAGALGALQNADRLEGLDADLLERVDARYRSEDGRWVGVSGRSRVLVYNSDLVEEADLPRSVFDLTDPRFRGQVAYAPTNASFQSFVTAMRVVHGEDRTRQWLEDFRDNDPVPFERNSLTTDAVDSGQVRFGLSNHYYLFEKADETPGGLDALTARNHMFPGDDVGSMVNVAGVGVLAGKADDRTAALLDYLLSEPAQTYFAQETSEYPLIEGVEPGVPGLPPLATVQGPEIDLSELDTLEETLRLLDEVGLT